jgi:hypothetical protein
VAAVAAREGVRLRMAIRTQKLEVFGAVSRTHRRQPPVARTSAKSQRHRLSAAPRSDS